MFIIVVGGGRLGTLLATKLKVDGNQVTIIDKSASTCNTVAENIRGVLVIQGDATDPAVLKEAKIEKADVLVCTTSFDEDNIVVCNIAKEMFNIKRTVSAVNNPQHLALYKYMNVDAPIDATAILARVVEEEASFSDVMNLLSIKKGRLSIVRIDIPDDAPVVGQELKNIKLPPNSVLISIIRGSDIVVPSGLTKILADDEIIAITAIDNEKELTKALIGNL